jgi:hypothetical protein
MMLVRFFIYSSAVILLLTAAAKFIGSAGHEKILLERDPIIGVSIKNLILAAASTELAVATVFLTSTWRTAVFSSFFLILLLTRRPVFAKVSKFSRYDKHRNIWCRLFMAEPRNRATAQPRNRATAH